MLTARSWPDLLTGAGRAALAAALREFVQRQRWFGGKARRIRATAIAERIPLTDAPVPAALAFVDVSYADGGEERYLLLPAFLPAGPGPSLAEAVGSAEGLARWSITQARLDDAGPGVVVDGVALPVVGRWIAAAMRRGRRLPGERGVAVASPAAATMAPPAALDPDALPDPVPLAGEQSNTSLRFADRAILKTYRRLQPGVNPDLEVGRFLTVRGFAHTPPVLGALEYHVDRDPPWTLAVLHGFVPNRGDAWTYTLEAGRAALAGVLRHPTDTDAHPDPPSAAALLDAVGGRPPADVAAVLGPYLSWARILGDRTGALHLTLASGTDDPAFAPEPFTPANAEDLAGRTADLVRGVYGLLRTRVDDLAPGTAATARRLLSAPPPAARFDLAPPGSAPSQRIRVHGDYHLGQVLVTDGDVAIIDFEGEPARPITERRRKDLALRDVAGMIRSFQYAAAAVRRERPGDALVREWTAAWSRWAAAAFLDGYLARASDGGFLPHERGALAPLLQAYLLDKVIYELGYELNNRPDWVEIPLQGLRAMVER